MAKNMPGKPKPTIQARPIPKNKPNPAKPANPMGPRKGGK